MTDITKYIKELLFSHDCVILPSFGGFIGNYRPAQIDGVSNTFSPPLKAISFNRNLSHNDGLLIGKISEDKKIGYADSKHIVDDYIKSLKRKLEDGERVNLESIGHFQNNEEGNVQFEPDREANFLLDSYGFTNFHREPVTNYDVSRRAMGRDRQPIRTSSSRKMALRAAMAIPLIAAMILVPLKTDLFKSNAGLNPVAAIGDTMLKDSEEKAANELVLNEEIVEDKEPAEEVTETLDKELIATNTSERAYYIVAGSFKNIENAKKLVGEASKLGFSSEMSESDKGFYRVYLDSFASKQDAIDRRSEILEDYPEAWILGK